MLPCLVEQDSLPLDSCECRFGLKNECKTLTVWRRSEEASNTDFFQPILKNSVSVIFWGCIGPNGVGRLVRCHGQINAVKYIEILQDNLHQSVELGEEKRQHDYLLINGFDSL